MEPPSDFTDPSYWDKLFCVSDIKPPFGLRLDSWIQHRVVCALCGDETLTVLKSSGGRRSRGGGPGFAVLQAEVDGDDDRRVHGLHRQ